MHHPAVSTAVYTLAFTALGACGSVPTHAAGGNVFAPIAQPQASGSDVWHHPNRARVFAADSSRCASTASQVAGTVAGRAYDAEFERCVGESDWVRAIRFPSADNCVPVEVSWVNPPADVPAPALDSLRLFVREAITEQFFPKVTLRELEARAAFEVQTRSGGSVDLTAARIVSASGGSGWQGISDFDRQWAVESAITHASFGTRSVPSIREYLTLPAVAVFHARCLRDFKPRGAY